MPKYTHHGTSSPMEEKDAILRALLEAMIPNDPVRRLPGLAEPSVGAVSYIRQQYGANELYENLEAIDRYALQKFASPFLSLSDLDKESLVHRLRKRQVLFFNELVALALECYFQNDHVAAALARPKRSPFPDGFMVPDGDLYLLEPVYERGKMYRDIP